MNDDLLARATEVLKGRLTRLCRLSECLRTPGEPACCAVACRLDLAIRDAPDIARAVLEMADQRRCETCKRWNRMPGHERGTCCWSKSIGDEALEGDTPFVAYEDGGGMAWLETRPNFGCACWEAKE